VCSENPIRIDLPTESPHVGDDGRADIPLLEPKSRLEAENAALRHQLIVLRRKVRGRVQLTNGIACS
jgi:hypothetical protein